MTEQQERIPWWRNRKGRNILGQFAVLAAVIIIIAVLGNNLVTNFQRLNIIGY